MMNNILIFNANDPLKTSGSVAYDLFTALKNQGHNVSMVVRTYNPGYPEGIRSMENKFSLLATKFHYKFRKLSFTKKESQTDPNYHFFELNEKKTHYTSRQLLKKASITPDTIFILFAKNLVNTQNMREMGLMTGAKIVWLMYDMAPLTGGCHYAWDCRGYENYCGSCPGLRSSDPQDASHKNLVIKKKNLDKISIQLIAASEWQYKQANRSTLFRDRKINKILLTVNPEIFKPFDKIELRRKAGIDTESKVIFFGAVDFTHKRKGGLQLIESLKILYQRLSAENGSLNILLLVAGKGTSQLKETLPFKMHDMGYLDNTYGIASAYQLADVFLCPSIEDSGPSMINQSMMCGTPVVSFEMGVAPDLVITGETGYKARLMDAQDLANGLYFFLSKSPEDMKIISNHCRELALSKCSPEVQMKQINEMILDSVK